MKLAGALVVVTSVRRAVLLLSGVAVAVLAIVTLVVTVRSEYRSVPTMILLALWVSGLGYLSAGLVARALKAPDTGSQG